MTDLVVLTFSFLGLAVLLGIEFNAQVVTDLFFYVIVVFTCLRIARHVIFKHLGYSKRILNMLLGNISGLIAGALLVTLASQFISVVEAHAVLIILSSLLAFFVLGTLSPLIRVSSSDRLVHR